MNTVYFVGGTLYKVIKGVFVVVVAMIDALHCKTHCTGGICDYCLTLVECFVQLIGKHRFDV